MRCQRLAMWCGGMLRPCPALTSAPARQAPPTAVLLTVADKGGTNFYHNLFLLAVPPPTLDHRWPGMSGYIGPGGLFAASHVDARVLVAHGSAGAEPIFHPAPSLKMVLRILTFPRIKLFPRVSGVARVR
jgi:hypothetical protein